MTTYERWYAPAGGTISVEAGGMTVLGSAQCTFTNQVHAGDGLLIRSGPDKGLLLQVAATPTTDLQLTIDKPWPGVTQAGLEFAILPIALKRSMAADIHARVSALYASLLHPFKVTGQPSDELGADGSIAIDQTARQFWIKGGGAWGVPINMVGAPGTPGEVSAAQLAAAIAGVIGGASAPYDTLKKIEDKLAPILAGANSAYDTFAEINSYITSDQSAAAAFNVALGNRLRFDAAQALTAEQKTQLLLNAGAASIAAVPRTNLLINADFQINQRAFAGGALSAGVYGHDRWKGGAGSYTVSGYTVTLDSGYLIQVVEPALWGYADFVSVPVTVSVDSPSADIAVTLGNAAGNITAGSGRRSVTLTNTSSGAVAFTIYKVTGGSVTFGRIKAEVGSSATEWQARPRSDELLLCQRYFYATYNEGAAPGSASQYAGAFFIATPTTHSYHSMGTLKLPTPMRTTPTITIYAAGSGDAGQITADAGQVPGVATNIGRGGCGIYVNNASVGTSVFLSCHVTASAEL